MARRSARAAGSRSGPRSACPATGSACSAMRGATRVTDDADLREAPPASPRSCACGGCAVPGASVAVSPVLDAAAALALCARGLKPDVAEAAAPAYLRGRPFEFRGPGLARLLQFEGSRTANQDAGAFAVPLHVNSHFEDTAWLKRGQACTTPAGLGEDSERGLRALRDS